MLRNPTQTRKKRERAWIGAHTLKQSHLYYVLYDISGHMLEMA